MTITNERLSELETQLTEYDDGRVVFVDLTMDLQELREVIRLARAYRAAQPTPRDGGETARMIADAMQPVAEEIEHQARENAAKGAAVGRLLVGQGASPDARREAATRIIAALIPCPNGYTSEMRDAWDAAEVAAEQILALLPACPEGFVLVPKEPTEAMLDELCCAMERLDWRVHARQAWEAALYVAAAPQPHEGKV